MRQPTTEPEVPYGRRATDNWARRFCNAAWTRVAEFILYCLMAMAILATGLVAFAYYEPVQAAEEEAMIGVPACGDAVAILKALEKRRDMVIVFAGGLTNGRTYLIVANERRWVILLVNADGSACIRGDGLAPTFPQPRV